MASGIPNNQQGRRYIDGVEVTPTAAQLNLLLGLTKIPINRINVQRVTASGAGTYTPTTGMKYVLVQAQAAGGGGGGAATAGVTQFAIPSGGGGGEYIEALFTATDIGASKPYSVGAKGTGGAAGNNNGTAGGNTTFNTSWIVATGGGLGSGSASAAANQFFINPANAGTGGSVATGTLLRQVPGGDCGNGFALTTTGMMSCGGATANGSVIYPAALTNVHAGENAIANTGMGGAGAGTYNTATQQAGGNGSDGFLNFIEFIAD